MSTENYNPFDSDKVIAPGNRLDSENGTDEANAAGSVEEEISSKAKIKGNVAFEFDIKYLRRVGYAALAFGGTGLALLIYQLIMAWLERQ